MQAPSVSHTGVSSVDKELELADEVDDEPADETPPKKTRQFMPSARFVAAMAALGVALALGWRYSGIEQWTFKRATVTAQAAPAAAAPAPESELARVAREVEALKKTLNEVIAANHQLTATVTALQAGQQELKQRAASVQTNGWHAQAAAMKYQMVAQPKGTTGSVKSRPAARAEVRAAPKPAVNAPLQLTAPRP